MDGQTQNPLESGKGPLTLDGALGSLLSPPEETQPAQTREPARPAIEQPPEREEPAAEQAQPDADATEPETEAESLPPLKAPSFWKKAARDIFEQLPRDAQDVFLEQERERNEGVERAMREAADKRKSAEAELIATQNERQRYQQQLQTFVPALQQQLQGKWGQVDWVKLADEQPAEYVRMRAAYEADFGKLQQAQFEQHRLNEQQAKEREKSTLESAQREAEKLIEKRPELKDPAKQAEWAKELTAYALSAGFDQAYLNQPKNHLALLTLEKAMLYDRAQSARTAATVKTVPKVQIPGAAKTKVDRAAEDRAARLKRLEQTGDIEDARGLLRG